MTLTDIKLTIIIWEISKYVIKKVWYKLRNKL
jgi:hypothetical protein